MKAVDEKCQIQALERTQPGLPWKKGRCGAMTDDYKRHGATTLFAAMNTTPRIRSRRAEVVGQAASLYVHFTPTGSSWLNMVERFFRALTDTCIRRGVFHDVNEIGAGDPSPY
jgi:transposase